MLGNDICLCIAGNKIDLEKDRHVTVQEAESYVTLFFYNFLICVALYSRC